MASWAVGGLRRGTKWVIGAGERAGPTGGPSKHCGYSNWIPSLGCDLIRVMRPAGVSSGGPRFSPKPTRYRCLYRQGRKAGPPTKTGPGTNTGAATTIGGPWRKRRGVTHTGAGAQTTGAGTTKTGRGAKHTGGGATNTGAGAQTTGGATTTGGANTGAGEATPNPKPTPPPPPPTLTFQATGPAFNPNGRAARVRAVTTAFRFILDSFSFVHGI